MRFDAFSDFEEYIEAAHKKIKFGEGVREYGPFLRCTASPGLPPWKIVWFVMFPDGKYMRMSESYFAESKADGGGGTRMHFSFHYGDTPPALDDDGLPEWRDEDQVDIRIDCDRRGPHLHFKGEDHISQNRVKHMSVQDQGLFDFFEKIMAHRQNAGSLEQIFGFSVEARK